MPVLGMRAIAPCEGPAAQRSCSESRYRAHTMVLPQKCVPLCFFMNLT